MFNLKRSVQIGLSFGLTSGTITTLGLMIGLYSGTNLKSVVLGGILTIAIADSMSDALGIHISQESDKRNSIKEVWQATISTLVVKFFYSSLYILPVIFLPLKTAIIISIMIGYLVLILLSYHVAKQQKENSPKIIGEHVLIMTLVVLFTFYFGSFINNLF